MRRPTKKQTKRAKEVYWKSAGKDAPRKIYYIKPKKRHHTPS